MALKFENTHACVAGDYAMYSAEKWCPAPFTPLALFLLLVAILSLGSLEWLLRFLFTPKFIWERY